jgi:hypothetical protein
MHKRRKVAAACAIALLPILFAGSASALPLDEVASDGSQVVEQAHASALPDSGVLAPACTFYTGFCKWSGTNFTGTRIGMPDYGNGTCLVIPTHPARSYVNYGNVEGYFYANSDCTGRSRAVTHDSQNPNIGFAAWSFRYACVSC